MPKKYGESHEETLDMLGWLAAQYERAGRPAEAVATYRRVLEYRRSKLGPAHPSLRLTLHALGELYEAREEFPEALRWFEQEAQVSTNPTFPGCHDELRPFKSMFAIPKRRGDVKAAAAYADRGIRTCEERGIREGNQAAGVEGLHVEAAQLFLEAGALDKAWCHLRSAELRRAQGANSRTEPNAFDTKRLARYQAQLAQLSKQDRFTLSDKRCESLIAFSQNPDAPLKPGGSSCPESDSGRRSIFSWRS